MERQVARFKKISEIDPEADIWVRVSGMVVDDNMVDDGSGMVAIEHEGNVEKGKFYVFVCRVIPDESGFHLRAVSAHETDRELFEKVRKAVESV